MWRKSSFCGSTECVEVAWRTAADSGGTNCVEAGPCACGIVVVRDSKNPAGPALRFTPAEWAAFVSGVKDGEFDLSG